MPTGCKIPLASRILALADAFDALTQDRIYRLQKGQPPRNVGISEFN